MTGKPVWKQESSHRYTLEHDGRSVELRYEPAGFQSGWAIYVGSRMIERCQEFMQARGVAMAVATR